jgi:hypothetical protein
MAFGCEGVLAVAGHAQAKPMGIKRKNVASIANDADDERPAKYVTAANKHPAKIERP